MKVECIQAFNETTGERATPNDWVTVGRTYTVPALRADPARGITMRIIADDGRTPAIFPADFFESIDGSIPTEWVAQLDDTGVLQLSPRTRLRAGFWEDYSNGVPEAVAQFDSIRAAIEATAED